MTDPRTGALVASLHEHAQKARSAAAGIEDPSTRRAVEELAAAVQELARHLKRTD
ncbi:hypothetical protein GKE82_08145 [Conexibacter sp. W3-3-2]|uniref:hypothetical protein n=1 Tax=Solirubrobacterales TaxID=588673 RepID=UPI0012B72FD8|nr:MULTISPECIES: hypothetical protein [Solirubrobacterales]MTD44268.1 hypothetical protein [Conexibacter sp. W3-3-2]